MAEWVFLRHGESVANAGGYFAGHLDVPLTELGRQQALGVGRDLSGRPFEAAYSSDLQRALETARLVLADRVGPPLQVSPALRERHMGSFQSQQRATLRETGAFDALLPWEGAAPGGESLADVARRALPFLAQQPDVDTLLVGHGGLIRMLVGLLDDLPTEAIGTMWIRNCTPIPRVVAPGRWGELARLHAP